MNRITRHLGLAAGLAVGLAAGLAVTGAAHAATPSPLDVLEAPGTAARKPLVRATLIAQRSALVPGGRAMLGIKLTIEPGWHVYWNGQNDTGFPVMIDLDLPKGLTARPVLSPAPHRHVSPGDMLDHVYENEVTLIVPVDVGESVEPGTEVTVHASVEWLVCKEACVPGSATLDLTLPVASAGLRPMPGPEADAITNALARVPVPIDKAAQPPVVTQTEPGVYTIKAPAGGAIAFYPGLGGSPLLDPIETAVSATGELELRLADPDKPLAGVIEYQHSETGKPAWVEVTPPAEIATEEDE